MGYLTKEIWSGRYGVVGFEGNGAAVIGKKDRYKTPEDLAAEAAERFRQSLLRTSSPA